MTRHPWAACRIHRLLITLLVIIVRVSLTDGWLLVRAYLSPHSPHWPVLQKKVQQLQQPFVDSDCNEDNNLVSKSQGFMEFDMEPTNPTPTKNSYPFLWLHTLAAERISFIWKMPVGDSLQQKQTQQQDDNHYQVNATAIENLETMLRVWRSIHQQQSSSPSPGLDQSSPIKVELAMPHHRKSPRRPKKTPPRNSLQEDDRSSTTNLSLSLIQTITEEYIRHSSTILQLAASHETPTISLRLLGSTTINDQNCVSWELAALTRLHPLPRQLHPYTATNSSENRQKRNRQQTAPSHKRIESFVVAHAAGIRPGDVVVDPACQRGTFLVEAAKYWPLAKSFQGYDTNIGHLEHACMNADATRTRLVLQEGTPWMMERNRSDTHHPSRSIHKLVTSCFLSSQYEKDISSLLKRWTECMCLKRGRMVLLVKQLAMGQIHDTVSEVSWNIIHQESMREGIIMAVIEPKAQQEVGPTPIEIKSKDEWLNWRHESLPWMVLAQRPFWKNQIILASGKIRKRSIRGR